MSGLRHFTKRRLMGLLVLMSMLCAAWSYTHRSAPKKLTFVFDYAIAPELQKSIKAVLQKNIQLKPLRAHEALDLLQETYSWIKRVTIHHKRLGHDTITIAAQQPYALIDDQFVLTTQDKLTNRSNYTLPAYESCLTCTTAHQPCALATASMIGAFLKTLPAVIVENYTCHWHDQTQIMLQHTHLPLQLTAESQTIFDAKLLESLHLLIEQRIMPEQAKKRRGDSYWTIDVRCKNYLILASHKGDMGHEKIKGDA